MNTAFERSQTRRNDFTEEQIAQITASVLQQMQHMSAPGPEMSARNLHDTGSSTQASPAVDRKSSEAAEQPQRINRGGLQDEVVISQTFIPPGIYMKEAERPSEYQPKSELRQPVSPTVADSTGSRPSQPTRMPTLDELTPLDRTWGQLFDEDGAPTVRLSQFLRGLANHLVRVPLLFADQ